MLSDCVFMNTYFFIFFCTLFAALPVIADDRLPPGVPRVVETNGEVLFIESQFTTPAYQNETLGFVMAEANKVAAELHLEEIIPITKSNLTQAYICPFGYSYMHKCVGAGNITTSHYWYCIKDDKFSDLAVADYDARCIQYQNKKYYLPVSQLDTNAAYRLAVQWLSDVHMDVQGLSRDCVAHIALTADMNSFEPPRGKITPIYFVWWTPKENKDKPGSVAYVELYLPTKTLLQLEVNDPKYILRAPVVFTNLAALFPGKATITTNWPTEIKPYPFPPARDLDRPKLSPPQ